MNDWLDRLPRATFGRYTRPVPAFRTCGVIGFYGAVVLTLGGGLLNGTPPLVLALVCLVAGMSFFAWAFLRRAVTGHESYVLLEHVWFAEAVVALGLYSTGRPVLPALDAMSVGLCAFLACGRIGCLFAGCCHGRPSSFGITYGEESVQDGFAAELEGVRLFPVPLVEAAGLMLIGATGLIALPVAAPGVVFTWFLIAYSILRFGLEGLRGDERPHLIGLSVNRWMCVTEFAVALLLSEHEGGEIGARDPMLFAVLAGSLVAFLALRRRFDPRLRLLSSEHVEELRSFVEELLAMLGDPGVPQTRTTSRGVTIGVSRPDERTLPLAHASISKVGDAPDLRLLCDLASEAFPALVPDATRLGGSGVVHVVAALGIQAPHLDDRRSVAGLAYRAAVLALAETSGPLATPNAGDVAFSTTRDAYFAAAAAPANGVPEATALAP